MIRDKSEKKVCGGKTISQTFAPLAFQYIRINLKSIPPARWLHRFPKIPNSRKRLGGRGGEGRGKGKRRGSRWGKKRGVRSGRMEQMRPDVREGEGEI